MKVHDDLIAGIGFDREHVSRTIAFHIDACGIQRRFNRRHQTFGVFNKLSFRHNSLLIVKNNRECPMLRKIAAIVCLTALTAALTACGIKGPLYLPDSGSPAQTASH